MHDVQVDPPGSDTFIG